MITFRSQEFESLGFEWDSHSAAELADHRKIDWECTNVPQHHSENPKLGQWVRTQRSNYRLQLEGKRLQMTGPRIQALRSLGFDWGASIGRGERHERIQVSTRRKARSQDVGEFGARYKFSTGNGTTQRNS
jgi:hypothetical protein